MAGAKRGRLAAKKAARASRQGAPKRRHSLADDISPLLLSVEEAAAKIRISRAQMYRIIALGQIETCKVGYLRRIKLSALEEYIAALPRQRRSA